MEKKSWIVTLVAAGAVAGALSALAPAGTATAADRRPVDATRPDPSYWPQGSETGRRDRSARSPQAPPASPYHADYHADYSVTRDGAARDPRNEGRDARQDGPTFPEPDRYRRAPFGWRR
jgi:hypothetical protein